MQCLLNCPVRQPLREQAATLVESVATFRLQRDSTLPMVERRGPDRARNVTRPAFKAKPAGAPAPATATIKVASARGKTGTDDWASF